MGLISKEDFIDWVEKQGWLIVNEVAIQTGRQITYLTSAGHFVIVQYNLKGDLEGLSQPPMTMSMPMPAIMGRIPPDFRGGSQMPGKG